MRDGHASWGNVTFVVPRAGDVLSSAGGVDARRRHRRRRQALIGLSDHAAGCTARLDLRSDGGHAASSGNAVRHVAHPPSEAGTIQG